MNAPMNGRIHPTAIIEAGACIDSDVEVGPYAVIGPHVEIGTGSRVGSHTVITGNTRTSVIDEQLGILKNPMKNSLFECFSLGNIDDRCEHKHSLISTERVESDLYWEL